MAQRAVAKAKAEGMAVFSAGVRAWRPGRGPQPRRLMRFRLLPWLLTLALCATGRLGSQPTETPVPPPNELGRVVVQNYSSRDILASSVFWDIAQDASGVLYFGNNPGIVTFDGATWRNVKIPGSTTFCRCVTVAADGTVFVGGNGVFGLLRPTGDGRHSFHSLVDQLPEAERDFKEIRQIVAVGDAVYVAAQNKILRWRGGRFTVLPGGPQAWLRLIDGTLYRHEKGQPFQRFEGERLVMVSDDPFFRDFHVRPAGRLPDGSLLFLKQRDLLFVLREGKITSWPTAAEAVLRKAEAYRSWQLRDGSLAFASLYGGVLLWGPDGRFLAQLDDTNGLANARVNDVFADRDGGVWISHGNGVARIAWPTAYSIFDRQNGLPPGSVTGIVRFRGSLYAVSAVGLFRFVPAQSPEQSARFERAATGSFIDVMVEPDRLLLGGTSGVWEFKGEGVKQVMRLAGTIYAVRRARSNPNLYWLGSGSGVHALRFTPEGWRDEGQVAGLNELVSGLVETADGKVWGSTGNLVFRLTVPAPVAGRPAVDGVTVERFPAGDGHPAMRRVREWAGRPVFMAQGEATLFTFAEARQRFVPMTEIDPLPARGTVSGGSVGGNQPDALWLEADHDRYEDKRIYRFARGGGSLLLPNRVHYPVNRVQHFHEETTPASPVVWIGGNEGVMRVELDRANPLLAPYAAQVWEQRGRVRSGHTLAHGGAALDFEFVAPRHTSVYPLEYSTRVIGEGAEVWSAWSHDRKRTLDRLAEGTYRFEVRAKDADGILSAPAALAFSILPPWWRTWWAYGGYVAALGLTIFGSVRLRTRALQKKNERLEKTVATRTEDLRRQNGELARLHKLELDEKISARLAAEKAQLDVLRYQLNPHFLFNSLTSIRSQIPPALGSARDTLDRLADFCRLTLHGRKAEERTTLGEEIAMLRAYLDIEQTRMGDLLSVTFEVDATLEEVMMPRLLLLPLVENALKYGQATSEDMLALKISAQRAPGGGEGVVFEISNTGTWVERGSRPGVPSTGIGHENLRERLLRHYPDAFVFSHSAADGWVHVRVALTAAPKSS